MNPKFRVVASAILLLAASAVTVVYWFLPVKADRDMNFVKPHEPWSVSAEAGALHKTLRIADLHADMLLWMRDPLKRHDRGHTDLPRLREGGVAIQVFSSVTKSPANLSNEDNTADSDEIILLAVSHRWPI